MHLSEIFVLEKKSIMILRLAVSQWIEFGNDTIG